MPDIQFYYDIASPYSYVAAARIERVAADAGVSVRWVPFLLGGVFRSVGNTMPAAVPARGAYLLTDLNRWAKRDGIEFKFSSSFPHNSLLCMRALTAAPAELLIPLSQALFRAAWVEDKDISDPAIVTEVLGEYAHLVEAASNPETKAALIQTTSEAVDLGAFGAPTFVVNEEIYWGNDRLEMAIEAARGA